MSSLYGKVALVTGAGGMTDSGIGMGSVMALALYQAGASVAALDIDAVGLQRVQAEAFRRRPGGSFICVTADVSSAASCEAAIAQVTAEAGGPDVLVNLAGITHGKYRFWEADPEGWQRVQAVNSTGPFLLARLSVPTMLSRGWGRIINVTTSFETMLDSFRSAYGPSKAALESSSAIWAKELEGTGVTVNCLLPGGMVANSRAVREMPSERMLNPEIMAAPVCWLASDASNGVNGHRFVARTWNPAEPVQPYPIGWPGIGPGRVEPP